MKITLIAHTPNPTKVVATAAWICTHADFLVAENVDKYLGVQIVQYLNRNTSDTYFSLVEDNYKLYVPEY